MKYLKLWYFFSKELLYYSYSMIAKVSWLLVATFIISNLFIYWMEHQWVSSVWGISVWIYVWYVFANQLYLTNWKDQDVISDIKSWNIIVFLNKPVNFFLFQLSQWFFRNLIKIFISWTVGWIVLFLFVKTFPWFWFINMFASILSLLLWLLCISLLSIYIWLYAFKFEDSGFMKFMISKSLFIFWWAFFPIDIYPHWLQVVVKYLPFQYFFYAPSKFFVTWDLNFFLSFFPIQVFWLIVLIVLNYLFYRKLVSWLEVNWG